jgi:hypothetical protein
VLLWFCGTAIVSVWFVFRDPAFDYRLLCVGALVPDAIDVWFGGARALHSVTVSIAVLLGVVIASSGRKRWRKRALAIPRSARRGCSGGRSADCGSATIHCRA